MIKKSKAKVIRRFVKTSLFAAGLSFAITTYSKMENVERKIPLIFDEIGMQDSTEKKYIKNVDYNDSYDDYQIMNKSMKLVKKI